jgi:hypothetical protein
MGSLKESLKGIQGMKGLNNDKGYGKLLTANVAILAVLMRSRREGFKT